MPAIPKVIETAAEMSAHIRRRSTSTVALVPTMGALHSGHLALVEAAKGFADIVVVSIFVNPTQFGPSEDLDNYPRSVKEDLASLKRIDGVDSVFLPTVAEMYPDGPEHQMVWVTPSTMADVLCGAHRPGHFRGVTTVVTKLLAICRPDVAVFGLKDAQQFVILTKMVRDLGFQLQLHGVPTVREEDGLALSSRNRYLSVDERLQAVVLSRAVGAARDAIERGKRDADAIRSLMVEIIDDAELALVQYADVVDARSLVPLRKIEPGQHVLCALAVFFGGTRLIDNSFSVAG